MKKMMTAMVASGLMALGAIAAPTLATETVEAAPLSVEVTPTVTDMLEQLGHAEIASSVEGKVIEAQGFPFPPGGGNACEGYTPPPNCVVEYNDGSWCTQRCYNPWNPYSYPVLEVCDCVQ